MENARLREAAPTAVNVTVGQRSRELREAPTSPYVFISERRAPLSVAGYQRMVARAGVAAKFTFLVHSHMLRHACGFKLANDGHDTRAIQAYQRLFAHDHHVSRSGAPPRAPGLANGSQHFAESKSLG